MGDLAIDYSRQLKLFADGDETSLRGVAALLGALIAAFDARGADFDTIPRPRIYRDKVCWVDSAGDVVATLVYCYPLAGDDFRAGEVA